MRPVDTARAAGHDGTMTFAQRNDDTAPARVAHRLAGPGVAILLLAGASDIVRTVLQGKDFAEDGALEIASATGYVLALAVLAGRASGLRGAWPAAVLLLAGAARELDLDKRFTEPGLLQSRLYTGDAALAVKLVGLAVILAILAAAGTLILRDGRAWLRGLAAGAGPAWWVAGALGLAALSKTLDGLGRKLAGVGIDLPGALDRAASLSEEVLELGIPIALILALTAGLAPARGLR